MALESDDEDFAEYGSSLEPLDEESLPRKKAPNIRDQVATDKYGRRRFHGAFTGGFSAGFFNSVGSLEGWTPSSFKSSRSEKAKSEKQRPEDFMDDEDMDEFGIAPKVLRATSDFNDATLKRKRIQHVSDGPIPGDPVLKEILQAARETVGIKLLMKMGWKPGQGTGSRVSKAEKKRMKEEYRKSQTKIYGCSLPQQMENEEESDSESDGCVDSKSIEDISFAPEDLQPISCKPKDNFFGLGYSGLDRKSVLSGHVNLFGPTPLKMEEKKKKVLISGQAFGVGAFEEDDEDIYSREDMSQYDFSLDSMSVRVNQKQPQSVAPSLPSYAGTVLEGFLLAKTSDIFKKFFPPPVLPQGFQPKHEPRKSRFQPAPETSLSLAKESSESRKKRLQHHTMTAVDRAHILEEPVTKLSPKKLESLKNKEDGNIDGNKINVSMKDGCSSFRPFISDPEKEKRYEQFLQLCKNGEKEQLSYYQPITMTEWEREREKVEFGQAARLYQPLSGMMSDRFVTASQSEDLNSPLSSINKPEDQDSLKREASKMKMFGHLTREEFDWRPCSLLCKRFNVPELFPGSGETTVAFTAKTSKFSVFNFLEAATHNKTQDTFDTTVPEKPSDEAGSQPEGPQMVIKEEEPEMPGGENIPQETSVEHGAEDSAIDFPDPPAKIDLFKAIFLSSSEDSEEDDDSDARKQTKEAVISDINAHRNSSSEDAVIVSNTVVPSIENINNLERNTSPPRGVFANLDLDAINARRKVKADEVTSNASDLEGKGARTTINNEEIYGPQLPSISSVITTSESTIQKIIPNTMIPMHCEWVEKTNTTTQKDKHKKHKKSSKHKKHKSKSKHKKKRH